MADIPGAGLDVPNPNNPSRPQSPERAIRDVDLRTSLGVSPTKVFGSLTGNEPNQKKLIDKVRSIITDQGLRKDVEERFLAEKLNNPDGPATIAITKEEEAAIARELMRLREFQVDQNPPPPLPPSPSTTVGSSITSSSNSESQSKERLRHGWGRLKFSEPTQSSDDDALAVVDYSISSHQIPEEFFVDARYNSPIPFYALTTPSLHEYAMRPPHRVKDLRQGAPANATICVFDDKRLTSVQYEDASQVLTRWLDIQRAEMPGVLFQCWDTLLKKVLNYRDLKRYWGGWLESLIRFMRRWHINPNLFDANNSFKELLSEVQAWETSMRLDEMSRMHSASQQQKKNSDSSSGPRRHHNGHHHHPYAHPGQHSGGDSSSRSPREHDRGLPKNDKSRFFRCFLCGVTGHGVGECARTASSHGGTPKVAKLVKGSYERLDNPGVKICRPFQSGSCQQVDEHEKSNSAFEHVCTICGAKGHGAYKCP